MEPKRNKNYIAGIYLRLSRDDERAGESLSIENQKILVTKYVKEKGWEIKDVYVDDGYSGTNFDRPGVKRLLDDAKEGEINTIVGTMANRRLRELRKQAHHEFDKLYKSGVMSKQEAYYWLAYMISAPLSQAHIGYLGEYYCEVVIKESRKLLERKSLAIKRKKEAKI